MVDTEQGLKIMSKRVACMVQICATPGVYLGDNLTDITGLALAYVIIYLVYSAVPTCKSIAQTKPHQSRVLLTVGCACRWRCLFAQNFFPTAQDTRANRLHCLYPYGYLAETSMCPVSYLQGSGNLLRIINRPGWCAGYTTCVRRVLSPDNF